LITGGKNNTETDCVLLTDDVTIMTLASKNFCRSELNFQQNIFRIFLILQINEMVHFCNLIYQTTLV